MTDVLGRLASTAAPLLGQVDVALADAGAPPDDPVWQLLRRVRALPSDAVAAVATWQATPLEMAVAPLQVLQRRYGEALAGLPAHPPWQGAGAQAYGVAWSALRSHITGSGDDAESVIGRLVDTSRYFEATAQWVTRSRRTLAVALADVLGSAEAVTLVSGVGAPGDAAARIGAHVLAPVAAACDEGRQLHDDWHPRLSELAHVLPRIGGSIPGATLQIGD